MNGGAMSLRLKRLLVLGVVGLLATWLIFRPSSAVGQEESQTASGLRVAPLKTELIILPGKSDKVVVKVKNVTSGQIVVRSVAVDFTPNEDGSPSALSQSEKQLATSIRSFIEPEDGVLLEVDEEYEYTLPVEVPIDTTPGAYYGLVLFQAIPAEQAVGGPGQVSLTASVGHIVLVEVPGNIVESLQVNSLKIARKTQPDAAKAPEVKTGTLFSVGPNEILLTVKNTGNGFVKPFGTITIQNWRGNEVSTTQVNDSDPRANVLPGSPRTFSIPITEVKGIGRFTALASVGYGNGNEVITMQTTFWVLPLWFIGLIAVAIAGLAFVILKIINRVRGR